MINYKTIKNLANKFSDEYSYRYKDDLYDLCNRVGAKVLISGLNKQQSVENKFNIIVSPFTSIKRDRIDIAIGIGLFYLGFKKQLNVTYKESYWFALNLLMPEEEFKACWLDKGLKFTMKKFDVNKQTAIARAKTLNLDVNNI